METFEIVVGREVRVKGAGVRVKLASVDEDSRCPEGVDCIWAGNVRVWLVLSGAKEGPLRAELNTARQPQLVSYAGRSFRIVKVAPPRLQSKKIEPAEYRITMAAGAEQPGEAERQ